MYLQNLMWLWSIMKLDDLFYQRSDVVRIARDLLGKGLFTQENGVMTGGVIVETEAYSYTEQGCHAYQNRMTRRNKVMFGEGGHAYVYLCYGIHNLFNVVTNREGKADAVLIRALEPIKGIELMISRLNVKNKTRITSGPGNLTRALGIDRRLNGVRLGSNCLWIEDLGWPIRKSEITSSQRIGIDYAGEDALLPWRFTLKNSQWISK